MKPSTYKFGEKVRVKDHGDILFEIEKIKATAVFYMGKITENTYYDVRSKTGLTLINIPHVEVIVSKKVQSIDELLDTYNSFFMLEEIYKDGYYREEAEIVMEKIHEMYSR
ncbi:hypothetical protein BC351_01140 [Paenibacillus ferrarius]|uniref:Uncharacterized protein n=1 Tax=Paenibacillus ferrarius TaxID=1469647 RepID=A0A1V4HSN0_9BACL|nr:hypothetical protein [Paenibacillus ferrarius]OPH61876.1 hypothetical protein BC351_01140 [Paenibacillus ferrarius]